ncbi:hypothetical protein D3C71_1520300 [compost metagenome]
MTPLVLASSSQVKAGRPAAVRSFFTSTRPTSATSSVPRARTTKKPRQPMASASGMPRAKSRVIARLKAARSALRARPRWAGGNQTMISRAAPIHTAASKKPTARRATISAS